MKKTETVLDELQARAKELQKEVDELKAAHELFIDPESVLDDPSYSTLDMFYTATRVSALIDAYVEQINWIKNYCVNTVLDSIRG